MIKVLIADDEKKIIQLIQYLVDWDQFHMQIVRTETDGLSALNAIKEINPDIVISDIRMPNLDGIEMYQRAKKAGFTPYFIIVSGYGEFYYAQRAIQLGVEGYLLKPIKKKELEAILRSVEEKYTSKQERQEEYTVLLERTQASEALEKKNLLYDLATKKDPSVLSMTPAQIERFYSFSQEGDCTSLLIAHIYTGVISDQAKNQEINQFILPKLQKELQRQLKDVCHSCSSSLLDDQVVLLINYQSDLKHKLFDALASIKREALAYQSIYPQLKICISSSSQLSSIDQVPAAYEEANLNLLTRFTSGEFLLLPKASAPHTISFESIFPNSFRKEIMSAVELLEGERLKQLISQLNMQLGNVLSDNELIVRCMNAFIETFCFALTYREGDQYDTKTIIQDLNAANRYLYSFSEICQYLSDYCSEVLHRLLLTKQNQEERPIRLAKQYIRDHYSDPLTLETVSREVGFNPAYFSSVFKKTTSQNFMDYLKEVRIEKAKGLLLHTSDEIGLIALKVGYSDVKYFTRLFRKLTRMTPTEYRRLYS